MRMKPKKSIEKESEGRNFQKAVQLERIVDEERTKKCSDCGEQFDCTYMDEDETLCQECQDWWDLTEEYLSPGGR